MSLFTTHSVSVLILLTAIQLAAMIFIIFRLRNVKKFNSIIPRRLRVLWKSSQSSKNTSRNFSLARPGITVVIAMFMILMFMIQMSSIMEMTTNSIELHKGYLTTRQAYYNARSGLELGLLSQTDPEAFEQVAAGQGITLPTGTDKKYKLVFSDGSGKSLGKTVSSNSPLPSGVTWKIQNQDADVPTKYDTNGVNNSDNGWQIFPFPGTGTLGAGDCDIEQWKAFKDNSTIQDENFLKQVAPFIGIKLTREELEKSLSGDHESEIKNAMNEASATFLDHPCLWNTLEQSQAAVIPLYTNGKNCPVDFQKEKICNPKDLDLTDLIVKIRTPCEKDGKKICAAGNRYQLNNDGLTSYDTQKVVLWGISATCQINNFESKLQSTTCYFTGAGPVDKKEKDDLNNNPKKALPKKVQDEIDWNKNTNPLISWITGYILNKSKDIIKEEYKYYALDFSDKYADDLKNLNIDIKDPDYSNWKTNFLDEKPTILSAIKGKSPWTTYPDSTNPIFKQITKSKLILEIATIMKDNSTELKDIPNLEYQIIYKTNNTTISSPIADPVIVADGYHGNFHSKLQVKMSTLGAGFSYVAIPTD